MIEYYIRSSRYAPEIWRKKGFFFTKWELIGEGGRPGNLVDGIYYIFATWPPGLSSRKPSPCSYCGKERNYYLKKYKSDAYRLKRRPPAKAQDLSIFDKVVIIVPYFYTKCSGCGGVNGPEERDFVVSNLHSKLIYISDRYDDESLLKIEKDLRDLNKWNVENFVLREEDFYETSDK